MTTRRENKVALQLRHVLLEYNREVISEESAQRLNESLIEIDVKSMRLIHNAKTYTMRFVLKIPNEDFRFVTFFEPAIIKYFEDKKSFDFKHLTFEGLHISKDRVILSLDVKDW